MVAQGFKRRLLKGFSKEGEENKIFERRRRK
jgi:hypothetical protein